MVGELAGFERLIGLQPLPSGEIAIAALRSTSRSQVIMGTIAGLDGGSTPVLIEQSVAAPRLVSGVGPGGGAISELHLLSYRHTRDDRTIDFVREILPVESGGPARSQDFLGNGRFGDPIPTHLGLTCHQNGILAQFQNLPQPNGPPIFSEETRGECYVRGFSAATQSKILLECGIVLWFVDLLQPNEGVHLMSVRRREGIRSKLAYYRSGDEERIAMAYWPEAAPGPHVQIFDLSGRALLDEPLVFSSQDSLPDARPMALEIAGVDSGSWGLLWSYDQSHRVDPGPRARAYFSRFDSCARPPSR